MLARRRSIDWLALTAVTDAAVAAAPCVGDRDILPIISRQ